MNKNLIKRIRLGILLGLFFGLLCFWGFSINTQLPSNLIPYQKWSLNNPRLWSTVINRITVGLVIALGGVIAFCPFSKIKIKPFLRGLILGILISLPMALDALIGSNPQASHRGFWIVLVAGGLIGMIIDIIATRKIGDGWDLLK